MLILRSAGPICVLEQVAGIEPALTVWKTVVLAVIRYLHSKFLSRFLTYILYTKFKEKSNFVVYGAQGGTRTLKTLILSQIPMPIRLLGQRRAQGIATRPRDMNSPTLTALTEVRAVYL